MIKGVRAMLEPGPGQIAVRDQGDHDVLAARHVDRLAKALLERVVGFRYPTQARIAARVALKNGDRVVARCGVDHDMFEIREKLRSDAIDRLVKESAAVTIGREDADFRSVGHAIEIRRGNAAAASRPDGNSLELTALVATQLRLSTPRVTRYRIL